MSRVLHGHPSFPFGMMTPCVWRQLSRTVILKYERLSKPRHRFPRFHKSSIYTLTYLDTESAARFGRSFCFYLLLCESQMADVLI